MYISIDIPYTTVIDAWYIRASHSQIDIDIEISHRSENTEYG